MGSPGGPQRRLECPCECALAKGMPRCGAPQPYRLQVQGLDYWLRRTPMSFRVLSCSPLAFEESGFPLR